METKTKTILNLSNKENLFKLTKELEKELLHRHFPNKYRQNTTPVCNSTEIICLVG